MKLQNGYKVIYEKAADGKRTFYASKSNVYPNEDDLVIASFNDADYAGKMIYEHEGKFYVTTGAIPTYNENGVPADEVVEGFDKVFNNAPAVEDLPAGAVTATFTARVNDTNYKTLAEAITAAENNQTVELLDNCSGCGVVIDKSVIIDFGGYTYTFTEPAVGSRGTETNGFQLLKGNNVVLRNGALQIADEYKDKFYILVQNYSNLTIEDMTLDGTNLDRWSDTDGDSYVLSNNSGTVDVIGETNIIANEDGDKAFAFDVCKYRNYTAPTVNVATTGKITGKIEVTESIAENLNISSGIYTTEIQDAWCADGYVPVVNNDGTYTVKAK